MHFWPNIGRLAIRIATNSPSEGAPQFPAFREGGLRREGEEGDEEVPTCREPARSAVPDAVRLAVRSRADHLTTRLQILNSLYPQRPTGRPNTTISSSSSSSCSLSSDGSLTSPSVTGTSARTKAPCRLCAWRRSKC